ncbi:hypothetical protein BT96DRAFT_392922 [Gymnopus androsaceus JB14]|uniref:Uncharacterized protein n=1 Tax=Gymnopus androsaceus JB14 TaxID=1447944 RepID=A0A6A4GX74_9AGAR|nr:hypothetical protein BT96DRAFT_392922 [Gymnopus androsaceus JB14]
MTVLITTEDVSVVPFQMQERFKIVGWSMKLFEALGLRYGGICLVKTDDVRAFHASYRNAQEQVKKIAQEEDERVRKTWAKHNLLPYLDIAFDLIECKDLLHPTSEDLSRNRVMKWTASADELPKCVQTKKDQMEAKRQWPNMRQRLTISAEVSFETRGLSMYEFFEREQSTDQSSEDPSSTQSTDIPMLETSPNVFMLEATCISTICNFQ